MAEISSTRAPCELRFVELSIVLRTTDDGPVEQIGDRVFLAPDGRFVTYATNGSLAVWSNQGKFLQSVGRLGKGPGEFADGPMAVHFDAKGNAYVRDNNLRWSVLSPAFQYVRSFSAAGIGYSPDQATMRGDGTLLSAELQPNRSANHFHIYDFARLDSATGLPPVLRAFSAFKLTERTAPSTSRARLITRVVDGAFWAAASEASRQGYVLEQWSDAGVLQRTIRRSVGWFPAGATPGGPESRPNPRIVSVHDDGSGVLFIQVIVANAQWRLPSGTPAERREARYQSFDIYTEVIDARSATLLASLPPLPAARVATEHPRHFPNGGRLGYRHFETEEGYDAVRIMEFRLVETRTR